MTDELMEWISVEDERRPKEGQVVDVLIKGKTRQVDAKFLCGRFKYEVYMYEWAIINDVTHWMSLLYPTHRRSHER